MLPPIAEGQHETSEDTMQDQKHGKCECCGALGPLGSVPADVETPHGRVNVWGPDEIPALLCVACLTEEWDGVLNLEIIEPELEN